MIMGNLGQNYVEVYQFEMVFATDSKPNSTQLFVAFIIYSTRIPEVLFQSLSKVSKDPSSLSFCIGLSSPCFPFLPQHGFPSFKYHFSVPSEKEDLEEDFFVFLSVILE